MFYQEEMDGFFIEDIMRYGRIYFDVSKKASALLPKGGVIVLTKVDGDTVKLSQKELLKLYKQARIKEVLTR